MRKWQKIIASLAAILVVGATACSLPGQADTGQPVTVERGDLTVQVTGSGSLATRQEARLSFRTAGKIAELPYQEGDLVAPGAALARLETDALALAKKQAEVDLAEAEAGLLAAGTAVTQAELTMATARRALDTVTAKEDALKLALLNAEISREQAQRTLSTGIAAVDFQAAEADLRRARAWYQYLTEEWSKESVGSIDDYDLAVERAARQVDTAQARYDNILSGFDDEDITIKSRQVTAAEMAVTQAQHDLADLAYDIALKELAVKAVEGAAAEAAQGLAYAGQQAGLARQALALAEKNLKDATLVAPFGGVVASVATEVGDIVDTATMVVRLVAPQQLELLVEVDEMDVPGVKLGQEARISVDALPDDEFTGRVAAIYPVPAKVTGLVVYNVSVSLAPPADAGLKIGMRATADIVVAQKTGVLKVPSQAIKEDGHGGSFVRVNAGKTVEERPVTTGLSNDAETEITGGLAEGETVLD